MLEIVTALAMTMTTDTGTRANCERCNASINHAATREPTTLPATKPATAATVVSNPRCHPRQMLTARRRPTTMSNHMVFMVTPRPQPLARVNQAVMVLLMARRCRVAMTTAPQILRNAGVGQARAR